MLGISLVVMLGAVQSTILGYSQVSADGAAFVAAHSMAINSSASGSSVVSSVFPNFAPDSVNVSAGAGTQQATISKSVDGFVMIPGLASSYQLNGADTEFAPDATSQAPQDFSFAIDATLNNYCSTSGSCSPRSIYLAQHVDTQSGSNGWNGPFSEWRCHQQYYASVNWPAARPTGGLAGSSYDPESPKSLEYPIYQWDGGHVCK